MVMLRVRKNKVYTCFEVDLFPFYIFLPPFKRGNFLMHSFTREASYKIDIAV